MFQAYTKSKLNIWCIIQQLGERKQLQGRETFTQIVYRESTGCGALETGTRLPCPPGAYRPLQETDIEKLRVQQTNQFCKMLLTVAGSLLWSQGRAA